MISSERSGVRVHSGEWLLHLKEGIDDQSKKMVPLAFILVAPATSPLAPRAEAQQESVLVDALPISKAGLRYVTEKRIGHYSQGCPIRIE